MKKTLTVIVAALIAFSLSACFPVFIPGPGHHHGHGHHYDRHYDRHNGYYR